MSAHNPLRGAHYMLRGFSMMWSPGLKRFVLAPLLINLLVYTVLWFIGYHYMTVLVNWMDHWLPHGLHWLHVILWPIFFLTNLIIVVYTFILVANIIAAPFNSFLAEKVAYCVTGQSIETNNMWQTILKDIWRTLGREWQKLRYYLPRMMGLFILSFIPVINVVASPLWIVFASWMMAVQYLDYPMDNHRISFEAMMRHLRQHRLSNLGFGGLALGISLIPLINFFAIPAAVVGATLKWLDER